MLKSGEKGLIGSGSNDYGRSEPIHAHKVIKNEQSGNIKTGLSLASKEIDRLNEKVKEQELIIHGIEEGCDLWKAKYENLLHLMNGVATRFGELKMIGAHNFLVVEINKAKNFNAD